MAIKSYRYRIYPSKRQTRTLNDHLAICCELYNAALQERRDAYHLERKAISRFDQIYQLPEIRSIREDAAAINANALEDVLTRVDKAFKGFFRRVRRKEKAGFPRFCPCARYDSLTYPQRGFSIEGARLKLSKVGKINIKMHRSLEGKIKTLIITRSSTGKWFACFSVEVELSPLPVNTEAVGVDVGLTHFATLSTGEQIPNPRFFRTEQEALARAQRRLSAEKKGTPEREKQRKVVARTHERIKFRRHNFAHQLSRYLVDRFGLIVFEDLNIRGMVRNHCLAKSIADAAWNQQVDPRNTSRLTACCGELVEIALSDRVIHCPKCHSAIDRDWNASLNIRARGLASLGLTAIEAPI